MTCEVSAKRAILERAIISHGYSSREAREAARELAGLVLSRAVGTLRAGSRGLDLVRGQPLQGPYGGLARMVAIREGWSRGEPVVVVTREELQRAARTLAHKPIDIDHLLFPIPIATMFDEISEAYATKWGIDVTSWCGTVLDADGRRIRARGPLGRELPQRLQLAGRRGLHEERGRGDNGQGDRVLYQLYSPSTAPRSRPS